MSEEKDKKVSDQNKSETNKNEATNKDNYPVMKELMESLNKTIMEIGEKAYQNANTENSTEGDAIETDFSTEKE